MAEISPGVLTQLAGRPWLGICISTRTCYEPCVIPQTVDKTRCTRIAHSGFAEVEYDAANRFFQYYGLEPSVPLLLPEFDNPLFLKLFCKSLKDSGQTRIPSGLQGISAIFRFFVEAVNGKLARSECLDYDPRRNVVSEALLSLADKMANTKQTVWQSPRLKLLCQIAWLAMAMRSHFSAILNRKDC